MKTQNRTRIITTWILALYALWMLTACSTVRYSPLDVGDEEILLYEPVSDPFEPVNRSIGAVNHVFMAGVIAPSSKAYRLVLPLPVRDGIRRVGHNLAFPVRLVNNLLQVKLDGAAVESHRFLVNSTIGLAGVFDPATKMGIGRSDEDTGQTLGAWGWKAQAYLMLPLLGPSNERDLPGRAGDMVLNPATYFSPAGPIFMYNDLVYKVDPYLNLVATEYDPYFQLKTVYSLEREQHVLDLSWTPKPDDEAVQTLNYVAFFQDNEFSFHALAKNRKAKLESTGKKLPYSYWLQPDSAPVVYLLPGLGVHRLNRGNVTKARILYNAGYSVVTISSNMHPEFMINGSSVSIPGYPDSDYQDVRLALKAVRADMHRRHSGRMGREALMGFSHGGFIGLLMAARESTVPPEEHFERYIAINTPVDIYTGMQSLDDYLQAPLQWDVEERSYRIRNALMKLKDLNLEKMNYEQSLPFDSQESRFLIGFNYRLKLRDSIYVSQRKEDLGILQSGLSWFYRAPAYAEIVQYSYEDYFNTFVFPYFSKRDNTLTSEGMLDSGNLRTYEEALAANEKCRVVNNRNDFLSTRDDVLWLERVFGEHRLHMFDQGGHMGNLHHPEVQEATLHTLEGLKD